MKITKLVCVASCCFILNQQNKGQSLYDDFNATSVNTSLWTVEDPFSDSSAVENGGVSMYFRIDQIEADKIDHRIVILHELAHCYFFAIGKFSFSEYQTNDKHRNRCERETIRLSEMWFRRIQNLDKKNKDI